MITVKARDLIPPDAPPPPFRLATVMSTSGGTFVRFDGEEEASAKSYARLSSASISSGQRVLMAYVGGTYVIMGRVLAP